MLRRFIVASLLMVTPFLLAPTLVLRTVAASTACITPYRTVFLPWATGWNYPAGDVAGTANPLLGIPCHGQPEVYSKSSNFYNITGQVGTYPYLNITQPQYGSFPGMGMSDYGSFSYYLGAYGYFGGEYSSALLTAFRYDMGDSLYWFGVTNHTYLSVWYLHPQTDADKHVMIDGLLYNARTHVWTTLGDFYSIQQGVRHYLADQNGVRLNAAYHGGDQAGTWLHSVVNLDPVFNDDNRNWYVMGLFVRFDNSYECCNGQYVTGKAITYFSDVRFTYLVSQANRATVDGWNINSTTAGSFVTSAAEEAWYVQSDSGYWDLRVRSIVMGWVNASQLAQHYDKGTYTWLSAFPQSFNLSMNNRFCDRKCSLFSSYTSTGFLPASGVNLTGLDYGTSNKLISQTMNDIGAGVFFVFTLLAGKFAVLGLLLNAVQGVQLYNNIISDIWQLLTQPASSPADWVNYTWPQFYAPAMNQSWNRPQSYGWTAYPNSALGTDYIYIPGLPSGRHYGTVEPSISLTVAANFTYNNGGLYQPINGATIKVPLSLHFNTTADTNPVASGYAPLACSAGANPTSGSSYVNVNFTSTCTGGMAPYSFYWQYNDGTGNTNTTHSLGFTTILYMYQYSLGYHGTQVFYPTLKVTDRIGAWVTPSVPSISVSCLRFCPLMPAP